MLNGAMRRYCECRFNLSLLRFILSLLSPLSCSGHTCEEDDEPHELHFMIPPHSWQIVRIRMRRRCHSAEHGSGRLGRGRHLFNATLRSPLFTSLSSSTRSIFLEAVCVCGHQGMVSVSVWLFGDSVVRSRPLLFVPIPSHLIPLPPPFSLRPLDPPPEFLPFFPPSPLPLDNLLLPTLASSSKPQGVCFPFL